MKNEKAIRKMEMLFSNYDEYFPLSEIKDILALLREPEKPIANEAKIKVALEKARASYSDAINLYIDEALSLLAEPEKPVCPPKDDVAEFVIKSQGIFDMLNPQSTKGFNHDEFVKVDRLRRKALIAIKNKENKKC